MVSMQLPIHPILSLTVAFRFIHNTAIETAFMCKTTLIYQCNDKNAIVPHFWACLQATQQSSMQMKNNSPAVPI